MLCQILASAVAHKETARVAQCVVAIRTLAQDDASNAAVAQQGGLKALVSAFAYANNGNDAEMSRVVVLSASCICGVMSCSDIGTLVQAIGGDVRATLTEMLRHRR